MFEVEKGMTRLLLKEVVSEAELRSIATAVGLGSTTSDLLMLHSVLVPTDSHDRDGGLLIRFAHRSYQEYFLAHYLHLTPLGSSVSLPPLVAQFVTELAGAQIARFDSTKPGDSFLF
jgi:hypothetical protein